MVVPMDPNDPRWGLSGPPEEKPPSDPPPRWFKIVLAVTLGVLFGSFVLPVLIFIAESAWGLVLDR